jgi:serralysin
MSKVLKFFIALVVILVVIWGIVLSKHSLSNIRHLVSAKIETPPLEKTDLSVASTSTTTTSRTEPELNNSVSTSSVTYLLKNMHLTFSEDFNSFSRHVDSKGNVTCASSGTGTWQTVYDFCSRTNSPNHEAEVYTDPSFYSYLKHEKVSDAQVDPSIPFQVSNGILSITASTSSEQVIHAVGPWATFTSGLITTQFSFSQTYGYFEAKMKVPTGQGFWPAFWLLPVDRSWPPEIDAMEAFGAANPQGEGGVTSIHYAYHDSKTSKSCGDWSNTGVDITKDFHTYGVDVESTGLTYYFDGNAYAYCTPSSEFDKPFYMIINLAVGGPGSWPGAASTSSQPKQLLIEYVRAYQKN